MTAAMNKPNRCLLTLAAALIVTAHANAQTITDPAKHLASSLDGRIKEIRELKAQALTRPLTSGETPSATISLQRDIDRIYLGLIPKVSLKALQGLEDLRADKQVGDATGTAAGSTSLVSKGGTPAILAIAVENGALTQDISGTTVTFRGTPASIVKASQNIGYFDTLRTSDTAVAVLQKFSFAASFDTSRGLAEGAQPVFTADRSQFAGTSLRITAIDHKDPRAAVNDDRWNRFAFTQEDLDTAALAAFNALRADPAVTAWLGTTQQAIAAAPDDQVDAVVRTQFRALADLEISPAARAAVTEAGKQFDGLLKRRADVLEQIAGGSQLLFDIAYQKPATGPTSGNIKVVGSVGRSILLTGNASATFYIGDVPANTDTLRDIQGAVQLDVPFGNPDGIGRYVFTLATKVQHLPDDLVAGEGTLFPGTKGTIWLGQAKLTIPVKGSAAKIPLSVTLANRTELIAEKKLFARAQVGFSYDLDAVFSRFKP
jgi:hypothetical protein